MVVAGRARDRLAVAVPAGGGCGAAAAQGAWEGSLARYEPDGSFVERTPTVLFIYTDSKDDAARVAAGGVPYRLDLMLRYGRGGRGHGCRQGGVRRHRRGGAPRRCVLFLVAAWAAEGVAV